MYDVYKIRQDFPILSDKINGKYNAFLDSAASAQKPRIVIEKMAETYLHLYANVNRGNYYLSEQSTYLHENARKRVQKFINSASHKEIIFTRNATESINLVASTWGRKNISQGDEVLISEAEHHANLVPWQVLCEEKGAVLKIFKIADDGSFIWEEYVKNLSSKTKLVAITGMSNVLGTVFPIKEMIEKAHEIGAKILIDACQYVVHHQADVQDLDCDFLAFSGHKTYGPSGIGVLYGKYDILATMPPYQFGGDMVDRVSFSKTTFDVPPARFEAGTPAIVEAVGLGEALEYMMSLGLKNIHHHEQELTRYAAKRLEEVEGLTLIGTAPSKGGVFSFVMDGIHSQDLAFILNKEGVSIRVGHHCAEPLVHRMGFESVARASLGLYSCKEDIDALINALNKAKTFF